MRTFLLCVAVAFGGQEAGTTFSSANPQLAVQAFVEPEAVSPNTDVTVRFLVTPGRRMRIYAPGSTYRAVAIALDAQAGITPRPIAYPPSEVYHFEPLDERVPVYSKPFTLTRVIAVGPAALKGKERIALSGRLEYQACDDRVCFTPGAIPFRFGLKVKPKGTR